MSEPKVTINESSPSAAAVANAIKIVEKVDARGRTIKLKKPGPLAQYKLVELMGQSAANQTYMGMVLPLIYVVGIDEDAIPFPTSKMQVEALIQRLDDEGIDAVMEGVTTEFGKPDPKKDAEAIKN